MNYEETLSFLFAQLPMYQRIGKAAYKADLNNTIALLSALGNPQDEFKSVHIAGTNGKGSTSHILASVFQEAGYKTGLYTSPHLIDFRERIKINGELIDKESVVDFIQDNKSIIEEIKPSFFELTVALAFLHFKNEKVDIAIIETGLGGRLDSTNVIDPELSIITNIGLDHTQFLGNDVISIAKEKGGIIKHNRPVVIGESNSSLREVFLEIATLKNAPIFFAEDHNVKVPSSILIGEYQRLNEKTAFVSLHRLIESGWKISQDDISKGFKNIIKNTGLSGRYQVLSDKPKVVCDTAHNAEGLGMVLNQIENEDHNDLHIVLGMVDDKSTHRVLQLFPQNANYYFCKAAIPRSLDENKLKNEAMGFGLEGEAFDNVAAAFSMALSKAKEKDLIYIGGSTFVVADLLQHLLTNPLR